MTVAEPDSERRLLAAARWAARAAFCFRELASYVRDAADEDDTDPDQVIAELLAEVRELFDETLMGVQTAHMTPPAFPRRGSYLSTMLNLLSAGNFIELHLTSSSQGDNARAETQHLYASSIFMLRAMGWPIIREESSGAKLYSMRSFVPAWTVMYDMPVIELSERADVHGDHPSDWLFDR
jgi:hypothetical protein